MVKLAKATVIKVIIKTFWRDEMDRNYVGFKIQMMGATVNN